MRPRRTGHAAERAGALAASAGALVLAAGLAMQPGGGALPLLEEPAPYGRVTASPDGLKEAPAPRATFRGHTCSGPSPSAPGKQATDIPPGTWVLPGRTSPARWHPTGKDGSAITLPPAPEGVLDLSGARPGEGSGVVLMAGHVDHEDGRLSPWAELRWAAPCQPVMVADASGKVHEYLVTDLYTVPQGDLPAEDIFRTAGRHELVMVTCSGPSVQDAGGPFRFNYSHNLVLRASLASRGPHA